MLCGMALYILSDRMLLSLLLFGAALLALIMLDKRQWDRYQEKLRMDAAKELRRESWLKQEADRIRQAGGMVLYPIPDKEALLGLCLRFGQEVGFHCFGEPQNEWIETAQSYGCKLKFHPWGEGEEPSRAQVTKRLERDVPKRKAGQWRRLLSLPGNRYPRTRKCYQIK